MKIITKPVIVKGRFNDGTPYKYSSEALFLENIIIRQCGCGVHPKILQNSQGRKFYDYEGEVFSIECSKCKIILNSKIPLNTYTTQSLNQKASIEIKKLIRKWNNSFKNNPFCSINFKTTV